MVCGGGKIWWWPSSSAVCRRRRVAYLARRQHDGSRQCIIDVNWWSVCNFVHLDFDSTQQVNQFPTWNCRYLTRTHTKHTDTHPWPGLEVFGCPAVPQHCLHSRWRGMLPSNVTRTFLPLLCLALLPCNFVLFYFSSSIFSYITWVIKKKKKITKNEKQLSGDCCRVWSGICKVAAVRQLTSLAHWVMKYRQQVTQLRCTYLQHLCRRHCRQLLGLF